MLPSFDSFKGLNELKISHLFRKAKSLNEICLSIDLLVYKRIQKPTLVCA